MTVRRTAGGTLAWVLVGGLVQSQEPQVNQQALALKVFSERVDTYVTLHRRLEDELSPLKPSPEPAEVQAHRQALAAAIRKARVNAKPGEIFTPTVAPLFRQVIRQDLQKREKSDAYAALVEVPRTVILRVNGDYPEGAPLATVPPLLLNNLQRLPEELEYRFLGRALILRDLHANLIVDYIEKALPRRP